MNQIWGYIGVIGSGKDFSAQEKAKETGGQLFDFSSGVRDFTFGFLGWRPDSAEDYDNFKLKSNMISFADHGGLTTINITGRKFLTNVGITLRNYDKDFWARYTCQQALQAYETCKTDLIFGSVRYPNEAREMLAVSVILNIPVTFIFTNFISARYLIDKDESEDWAKMFLYDGHQHMENITEKVKTILL